jgi:CubicO group peptidase (beta-lactamase class C family)
MPTKDPTKVDERGQPSSTHQPESVDKRITQVENGLVIFTENGQPQFGSTSPLAERMEHYPTPGVSIAVINEYKIAWVKGYGVRVTGETDPVTVQTLFHAGSVAKVVVGSRHAQAGRARPVGPG